MDFNGILFYFIFLKQYKCFEFRISVNKKVGKYFFYLLTYVNGSAVRKVTWKIKIFVLDSIGMLHYLKIPHFPECEGME